MSKNVIDVAKEIESCTEAMISIGKARIDLKPLAEALLESLRGLIEIADRGDEKSKGIALRTIGRIDSMPAFTVTPSHE